MKSRVLRVFLAVGLAMGGLPADAQQPAVSDPDVLKGIRLVDEGDYDAAILTLDAAARRLSRDPARAPEAAQAYLHLGVAYLGKGHEASARAQFREAIARVKNLNLTPDRFAPKVIEAFEQARAESAQGAAPAASPAAPGPPEAAGAPRPAASRKKGGSSKGLLIGGLVLAGLGGGIAAAGGGGGGAPAPAPTPTPVPRFTQDFTGSLTLDEFCRAFRFDVTNAGQLDARVSWTEANVVLEIALFDNPSQDNPVATSSRTSQTTAQLTAPVTPTAPPKVWSIAICHTSSSCQSAATARSLEAALPGAPPCTATFSLSILHP